MFGRIWIAIKLIASYLIPFFPCCPSIGLLEEGDCVWVQAFGRNSIPDEELGKTIWEILRKANSLTEAFTFLSYSGFDPGSANMALSREVLRLSKKYSLPIMAQWENVYCFWKIDPQWFSDNQDMIDCLWPPELGYFATWHVKLASREKMRLRGKRKPIEVCHPAMLARAVAIIWKLRVPIIVEGVSPWAFWKQRLWVWDKNSIQAWTTAFLRLAHPKKFWLPREVFGRYLHHPWKGWVSFIPPVA